MKRLAPALILLGALALTGCSPTQSQDAQPSSGTSPSAATGTANTASGQASASAVLDSLPVKGRAPKTGYSREQFGAAWTDANTADVGGTSDNGCDTRNDILTRDLVQVSLKPGDGCVVASGVLNDLYSGTTINFVRGQDTSSAVQIDHVIPLSDAWQKGAQQLSESERINLANDPRNLMAADGPLNGQKSDSDAASWLPPNKAFRCAYVARQVGVKAIYKLWVTQAEKDAIAGVLSSCPDEQVPFDVPGFTPLQSDPAPSASTSPTPAAPAPSTETNTTAPVDPLQSAPVSSDHGLVAPEATVTYANCAEAKAAGAAPVRIGDPGYSTKLDRDGDGIGCES